MEHYPPKIDSKFFCIINRDEAILAALILSYIDQSKGYIPTFEFPFVSSEDFETEPIVEIRDEHQLSRSRARKFKVRIGNAIAFLGGCEYLIVAGLTDKQKSYLPFLDKFNTIYIDSKDDVSLLLDGIVSKNGSLLCRESDIIDALPLALKNNLYLTIDNNAGIISDTQKNSSGLIVIERNNKVSCVFAILYANSIGADVELIDSAGINNYEIKNLIENWKNDEPNAHNNLSAAIFPYIEHIKFDNREFVTFFTDGIPYSVILKNIVPISHVHLRINPDFFVFNSIFLAPFPEVYSAVVFSPEVFENEETEFVLSKLSENNVLVTSLIDEEATHFNLDNHIQYYPYSLLHLCSHGGEVEGERITEKFIDSNGDEHIVEYDEVFSFGLNPFQDSNKVEIKRLPRKFDGLVWGSKELKEAHYPNEVFAELFESLGNRENQESTTKINIPGSCHITCVDSIYQAMFHHLAAMKSPVIFNNTCWSWSDIADSFIGAGATGYIGTLWNINNEIATRSAKVFYENIFQNSILSALHKALEISKGTKDENIYIFWGLHFISLKPSVKLEGSRLVVFRDIMDSLQMWKAKLEATKIPEYKDTISHIIKWLSRKLVQSFKKEVVKYLIKNKIQ